VKKKNSLKKEKTQFTPPSFPVIRREGDREDSLLKERVSLSHAGGRKNPYSDGCGASEKGKEMSNRAGGKGKKRSGHSNPT